MLLWVCIIYIFYYLLIKKLPSDDYKNLGTVFHQQFLSNDKNNDFIIVFKININIFLKK